MKTKNHLMLLTITILLLAPVAYLATQQPRLSLNAQHFGLILLRGGYRSWYLVFSDGQTWDQSGKTVSVVLDEEKGTMRYGYRWWPKYAHCDVRKILKAHSELTR